MGTDFGKSGTQTLPYTQIGFVHLVIAGYYPLHHALELVGHVEVAVEAPAVPESITPTA